MLCFIFHSVFLSYLFDGYAGFCVRQVLSCSLGYHLYWFFFSVVFRIWQTFGWPARRAGIGYMAEYHHVGSWRYTQGGLARMLSIRLEQAARVRHMMAWRGGKAAGIRCERLGARELISVRFFL